MHPRSRVNLASVAGALVSVALWFAFGPWVKAHWAWWGGLMEWEWIIVGGLGFVLGGGAAAVREHVLNSRDQREAAARLCDELGLTFSAVVEAKDLGPLAGSSLLREYTALANRMSGTLDGARVEVLDATYRVRSGGEQSDEFDWRRTVVFFPERTDLPDLSLAPAAGGVWLLRAVTGARGASFVPADGAGAEAAARFARAYVLTHGARVTTEQLSRAFPPEVLAFLADNPGWTVTVADGRVAMWWAERVAAGAKRRRLLEDAVRVYRALTEPRPLGQAPLTAVSAMPADLAAAPKRLVVLFLCLSAGLLLGGCLGGPAAFLCFAGGGGPVQWGTGRIVLFFTLFFGPALLGLALGGYVAVRHVLPRIGRQ